MAGSSSQIAATIASFGSATRSDSTIFLFGGFRVEGSGHVYVWSIRTQFRLSEAQSPKP